MVQRCCCDSYRAPREPCGVWMRLLCTPIISSSWCGPSGTISTEDKEQPVSKLLELAPREQTVSSELNI